MNIELTYPKSGEIGGIINHLGDPLPTQQFFHSCNAQNVCVVGGWGSGKSLSFCIEIIKDISIPNNFILLGRKDLIDLRSSTLKDLLDLLPFEMIVSHNKSERLIKFTNGTILFYTGLDENKSALKKIQSTNLGAVYVDQAEEITEDMYTYLSGRLRRANTRRCMKIACNPDGHNWIYKLFKRGPTSVSTIARNKWKRDYKLFEVTSLENIYLPIDTLQRYLNFPDHIKKRYVYCSWDDFSGLFYNEFIESKNKIDRYTPSSDEQFFISLDYGYTNPTAILFASVNYDSEVRVYHEYYLNEQPVENIANYIKEEMANIRGTGMNKFNECVKLMDPSTRSKQRDGVSVMSEFAEYGVYFQPANNNVLQGADRVNKYFRDKKLFISETCENTLTEISDYKWKDLKPGQKEGPVKKNDHAMDALRYLINYLDVPIKKEEKKQSIRQQGYNTSSGNGWASF